MSKDWGGAIVKLIGALSTGFYFGYGVFWFPTSRLRACVSLGCSVALFLIFIAVLVEDFKTEVKE